MPSVPFVYLFGFLPRFKRPCNFIGRRIGTDGVITTVAGNGEKGRAGDGGPATKAALGVIGLAIDSGDNIFLADSSNAVIRKVSAQGVISTVVGTGYVGDRK